MLFVRQPMPEISTSITSPGFIQIGGSRKAPTPPVVPVTIGAENLERFQADLAESVLARDATLQERLASS